jgi:hypothetical protein
MGECLQTIQSLGGVVVSVTTDGFITNQADVESKVSDKFLFSEFKKIRIELTGENSGLEQKNAGKGIIV